jgi:hypothetical protein
VATEDLRRLLWATPSLTDAVHEQFERALDQAVQVMLDEMGSEDLRRRIKAAGLFLRTDAAGRRGWGRGRNGRGAG